MGKANFVIVDRDNLFQDALAEISVIDNLRLPLEVSFMGEGAQDFGRPGKGFLKKSKKSCLTMDSMRILQNSIIYRYME